MPTSAQPKISTCGDESFYSPAKGGCSSNHYTTQGMSTSLPTLCGLYLAEIKRKDIFSKAKKVRVLSELQASYNAKLPGIYQNWYELGYWFRYVEVDRIAYGDLELSREDASEPTHSMKIVEPSNIGEAQGQ